VVSLLLVLGVSIMPDFSLLLADNDYS